MWRSWAYCSRLSVKSQRPPVNRRILAGGTSISPSEGSRTLIPASVLLNGSVIKCSVLIDSGAEGNFVDVEWAHHYGLPIHSLSSPLIVHSLNGQQLMAVTQITGPVSLITSGNHREEIEFYLFNSPSVSIVLGHPWLSLHNPHINWAENLILSWSSRCHAACLVSAPSSVVCSVLQEEEVDLSLIPGMYHNLRAVFSRSRAASLPPHRPYDCAIDLLPGTSPPRGRLFSLSAP